MVGCYGYGRIGAQDMWRAGKHQEDGCRLRPTLFPFRYAVFPVSALSCGGVLLPLPADALGMTES